MTRRYGIFFDLDGTLVDNEHFYKSNYAALLQSELVIRPGAIQFLSEAKEKDLHLALVSGASSIFVTQILNASNLDQYFDFVITAQDVTHKKPHPECYQLAMEKMKVVNEQVVVFEDTEAGLKAASRAGIACLCIRHAYNQTHDLSQAISEYDSFANSFVDICNDINSIFNVDVF